MDIIKVEPDSDTETNTLSSSSEGMRDEHPTPGIFSFVKCEDEQHADEIKAEPEMPESHFENRPLCAYLQIEIKEEHDTSCSTLETEAKDELRDDTTGNGEPKDEMTQKNEVGVKRDRFPKIVEFAYQICAMFGSTYMCEQLFSLMKRKKTPERSWLMDKHLSSLMKVISAQDLKPAIHTLAANKRCQISGKK